MRIVYQVISPIVLLLLFNSFGENKNSIKQTNKIEVSYHQDFKKISKSYLMDKDWFIEGLETNKKFRFTNSEKIFYLNGKALSPRSKYYLSNTNCKNHKFDHNKVGNLDNGIYFKTEGFCGLIRVISDKKFKLYNGKTPHVTYYRN